MRNSGAESVRRDDDTRWSPIMLITRFTVPRRTLFTVPAIVLRFGTFSFDSERFGHRQRENKKRRTERDRARARGTNEFKR